jgi:hypothetical protein
VTDGPEPRDERLRRRVSDALDSIYRPAPDLRRRSADAAARGSRRHRLAAPLGWVALTAVAIAALVLVLVRHVSDRGVQTPAATPGPTASARQAVYMLTADNDVVAFDRSTLAMRWRASVASPPTEAIAPGSMLAISRGGDVLYVLPPSQSSGGTTLDLLDATSGQRLGRIPLSASGGAVYRALAVDPRSSTVDVVGQDGTHLLVTEVDPQRQVVLATHVTRTLSPVTRLSPDLPGTALFTADGSRLYYSINGGNTAQSGIDWVDVSGPRLSPCRSTGAAACIPGRVQGFDVSSNRLVFADAALPPHLVETDLDGHVLRQLPTGFGSPASSLLLSTSGRNVLVVASCDNLGGLGTVDLDTGDAQPIATSRPNGSEPGTNAVCGQRAAPLSPSTIAVSQLSGDVARPQSPGTVIVVDTTKGDITRTAALPAEVVDLLAPS